MRITPDLFGAYLLCPTKCWLNSMGDHAAENAYAKWVQTQNELCRVAGIDRLRSAIPPEDCVISPSGDGLKEAKWRLATDVVAQAETLESRIHALERVPSEGRGRSAQFIPVRFISTNKLTRNERLLSAFDALVLSEMLNRDINHGKIIHGNDHATLKVRPRALADQVRKAQDKITALLSSKAAPELILNRHCPECEFRDRCRQRALEKDDLSLLAGMAEKERKKLHSKGIFTLTQLSYTFRVRRRCKRWKSQQPGYSRALKALAIREKKVHVIGRPKIELSGTPVYLDVEGTANSFYYLMGARIMAGEASEQVSFWADDKSQERTAFQALLAFLTSISKPLIICYGRYEGRFIRQMAARDPDLLATFPGMDEILQKSMNLLSQVYGRIYFPTFGNSLKDLAKYRFFLTFVARWSLKSRSSN
jgi:predicted RecB family nuclease